MNELIDKGEGDKAYTLLEPLIKKYNTPQYLLLAGKSMAAVDKPRKSLNFYKRAYQLSLENNDIDAQRDSLIGIGSIQIWLAQYVRASNTYKRLLERYPLSAKQTESAKASLAKSFAYRDRNFLALDVIPWGTEFTSPDMIEVALQTTLWTNQGDVAQSIYQKYKPVLDKIDHKSYLYRDLQNIEWLLCREIAPYQLTPEYYYLKDSEDFSIDRAILRARRYHSQFWQTNLALSDNQFSQYGQNINGLSLIVNQTWRPNPHLLFNAEVAPTVFHSNLQNNLPNFSTVHHWQPILWGTSASLTPNDFVSFDFSEREEIVDAFSAVQNRILAHTVNYGGTIQPVPYLTLAGNGYQSNFNDTNIRQGYFFLGTVAIWPAQGVYVGYRARHYADKIQTPLYFSPYMYNEELGLIGFSRQFAITWRYYAEFAYGTQTIKPDLETAAGSSPSWYYRVGINGPITKCIYFNLKYGGYDLAGAFTSGSDYRFRDILASLTFSFD